MKRWSVAAVIVMALSVVRIASTWTVFSATMDEPMHVSAGLQLYTQHTYAYQPENPPLPRVVLAFAPWLGGMDFDPARSTDDQLKRVFYSNDRYKTNLVLARAGNLVFFVLASAGVWLWARRDLGELAGFVATLLFTLQPAIAGHAGLATHDVAATAGLVWSLLAFSRWLEAPDTRRAALFGVAFGLAALCKFSCIGYVPAGCAAMYVVRVLGDRNLRRPWRAIAPAAATAILVVWVGYAFHPAPFFRGIEGLASIDRGGHKAFLFGELRTSGWWWYFPAAVALKSTVASLLLAFFTRGRGREALAAAAAILIVAMPSHLNLGVRYVLPLYAPLAVAGASALLAVRWRWVVLVLLAWHATASMLSHPDAMPYFNEAAGTRPWEKLLDSNIDWGQDALRLERIVRERRIDRIGIAVMGIHDWDALGFPPHFDLDRSVPSHGWIAVSEHLYGLASGVPWLDGHKYERVGQSIRLYSIP